MRSFRQTSPAKENSSSLCFSHHLSTPLYSAFLQTSQKKNSSSLCLSPAYLATPLCSTFLQRSNFDKRNRLLCAKMRCSMWRSKNKLNYRLQKTGFPSSACESRQTVALFRVKKEGLAVIAGCIQPGQVVAACQGPRASARTFSVLQCACVILHYRPPTITIIGQILVRVTNKVKRSLPKWAIPYILTAWQLRWG